MTSPFVMREHSAHLSSTRMDHTSIQRPRARNYPRGPQPAPIMLRPRYEWREWPEVAIRVRGLHPQETTHSLFKAFRKEGKIIMVELFEGRDGRKDGTGLIRFCPPPDNQFWTPDDYELKVEDKQGILQYHYIVKVSLDEKRKGIAKVQSPIKKTVFYEPKMTLHPTLLQFGLMVGPNAVMPLHTLQGAERNVTFTVDLLHNRIVAHFKVEFEDPRIKGDLHFESTSEINKYHRINDYMFQVSFSQINSIGQFNIDKQSFELVLSLQSPPPFFRKRTDDEAGHADENLIWSEFDTWYRQTDIVYAPNRLHTTKITLHKEKPVIDIGRWTTYVFKFQNIQDRTYQIMKQALADFNIEIVPMEKLKREDIHAADLWALIDPPKINHASVEMKEQFIPLPFEVRYQLEVCISRDILNEYNITKQFVKKVAQISSEDPVKARNILEYVADQEKRIYEPMTIFDDPEALAFSAKTAIPHYCAYSRKATITPSTIYFSSPTVETTNRVLRHYASENLEGRFLRVQFTDELSEGRINACAGKARNDELFTRVFRTLFNGIQIGDRHYEFLAFGNSQFRENGAYFFCPTENLTCADIRNWMGNFSEIHVVAKYAARLGQCFSTTRAINGLSAPEIVLIDDVEKDNGRGGKYCFTDGVGKISPFQAQMIAADLGIRSNTAPSVFQFRLGGCKGILAVWPEVKDKQVHIRKSQQKFTAAYNGLEIIRCSRFSCATLNRQTITILSSLGVPDEVFLTMLSNQLEGYQSAMSNDEVAIGLLLRYIDDNQMTINIATMIRNGFMAERDPFVLSLLHLWRSWSIKLLKEKAKIIVENGAFLLGCVDETDTLRGCSRPTPGEQLTEEELPQIFIQVPDRNDPSQYNVIEGICLVGRNPSLHPGDLRVVQAVNVTALHHLRNVVVFPRIGERDVPSMCSGGDLDGDDFFVIWDKALQPPEWNCAPMDYDAPKPRPHGRNIQIGDLMKFFVRFMKNDSLPTIAHAHLAQSDYLDASVKDPKCLELAQLHSKAVDYVKTGEPAQMPKRLRPRNWPHFMEKKHRPKNMQYHSHKILGQLYDRVETVNFIPQYEDPFDRRILRAYSLGDTLLKTVRQIKSKYDTAMKRLMAQQEINTEFEIWSTFVLSRPRVGSDYKVQEEIARLSDALKDQFRAVCIEAAGSKDFAVLGPFVAGMYKVTKEELDIALAECRATKIVAGREVPKRKMEPKHMPLISFPWLFEKELGRIATGIDTSDELEELGLTTLTFSKEPAHSRKRQGGGEVNVKDFLQQANGVIVHRGEELDLFRHVDSDDFSETDYEDTRSATKDHSFMIGDSGEVVLATEFQLPKNPIPEQFLSGTGVEDVIPRTELDGLIGPQEAARRAHESGGQPFLNAGSLPEAQALVESMGCLFPPDTLPVDANNHQLSSSASDSPMILTDSTPIATDGEYEADESVEEEEVDIIVRVSPLEKLARLVGGEDSVTKDLSDVEDVVEEEEVMEVEVKESSLEKLAAILDL